MPCIRNTAAQENFTCSDAQSFRTELLNDND